MPSDIGVKMGVTGLAQFKQSMNQAQQSVKTLDAALKLNEKQYKANGDAETYMQQKSKLLQQQIAAQNTVVKQGQQALDAMAKNGVDPASKSYQQMSQRVLEAQSALLDMHGDLGTFIIRVQHRQNSSWQGRITWVEEDKTLYFRSVWEMMKLIEEAMEEHKEEENKAPSWKE